VQVVLSVYYFESVYSPLQTSSRALAWIFKLKFQMNVVRRCLQYAFRLPRKPGCWLCVVVLYGALHVLGSYYVYYTYSLPETLASSFELKFSRPRKSIHGVRISANNTTTVLATPSLTLIPGPIFFNIFVSANKSNIRRILAEQLLQRNETSPNATIEYILIGDNALNEEIQQTCQPNCRRRKYIESGGEVETLQALWEHCGQLTHSPHKDVLVTYLHNKGSFHPTTSNEKARRMGTKSALDCRLLMASSPRQCTICTSAFHVFPQYLGSSK
jgi:hypothetical protein